MAETIGYVPSEALQPHLSPTAAEARPSLANFAHLQIKESFFSKDTRIPGGYASISELYEGFHLPHERKSAGSTSYHESQHVLVARFGFNFDVLGVSRKAKGNSRGRTLFAGDLAQHPYGFMITAAAGAVDHLGGKAEGHGSPLIPQSDLHVAASLSPDADISIEEAIERAGIILDSIPHKVRQTVADLIESKGEIFGESQINRMIDIALFEAEHSIDVTYVETLPEYEEEVTPYEQSVREGAYTIIEETENGVEVRYGNINDPENDRHCPFCQGEGVHEEKCPIKTKMRNQHISSEVSRKPEEHLVVDLRKI